MAKWKRKKSQFKKTNIKKYNHNSSFLYVEGYNNIAKIDCKTGEILWKSNDKPWYNGNNNLTLSNGNIIAYSYNYKNNHNSISDFNVINTENGEIACTIDADALQEYDIVSIKYIDPNFNYLIFSYATFIDDMGIILKTMGYALIKDNKLIVDKVFSEHATVDMISVDYFSNNSNAIEFSVFDNILYIYDDHFKISEGQNEYEHDIRSCHYKITAIDLNTFDVICEIEFNSSVITKSVIFNAEDTNNYCKIGCFITDKNVLLIDLENGFVSHEFNFEKNIVSSYSAKNGYLIINLADGSQKIIDVSNIPQEKSIYTVYNFTNYGILPYIVAYNGESTAIVSNNINGGKSVHIVEIEKNSDYNCILDCKSLNQNDIDSVLAIDSQGSYSVINSQINGIQKLMIFDINNNKIISETEANVLKFLGFFDDTHIYYLANDKELVIFNIIKGTSKKCYVSSDLSLLTFLLNNQRVYNEKILTIGTTYDRDANAKKYEVDAIDYISVWNCQEMCSQKTPKI